MNDILTIDGITYPVNIVQLTQTSEFADGAATGRMESYDLKRDLIGIFYNYELTLGDIQDPSVATLLWNKLHELVPFHTFTLPHNNTLITMTAYVTGCSRALKLRKDGINYWGGYTVKFIGKSPYVK